MRLAVISIIGLLMMSHGAMAAGKDEVTKDVVEEAAVEEADEAPAKPVKKKAVVKKTEKKDVKTEEKKLEKKADAKDVKKGAVAKEVLACPDNIKVEAQKLDKKNAPKGFGSFNAEVVHWLETVSVYSGDKVITKTEPTKGTEITSIWPLKDNGKLHYYLGCSYHDTSVIVTKALSELFKNCHVSPKADPRNPHGQQVLHAFACD